MYALIHNFNTGTGTGALATFTHGQGVAPIACILQTVGLTATIDEDNNTTSWRWSVGIATGVTSRAAIGSAAEDNALTENCASVVTDAACLVTLSPTSGASGVEGLLDVSTWDSTEVIFTVDDAFPADYRVRATFIFPDAGDSNVAVAIGSVTPLAASSPINVDDIFGSDGAPDAIVFLPGRSSSVSTSTTTADAMYGIGFAVWNGASYDNAAGFGASDDADDPTNTCRYITTAACIATSTTQDSVNIRARVTGQRTRGFTLTVDEGTTTTVVPYLAIRGGGHALRTFLTQTDTVTPIVLGSLGFVPKGGFVVGHGTSESTVDTVQAVGQISIGSFDESNQGCMTVQQDDNQTTTDISTAQEHDSVYATFPTLSSGAITSKMDVTSLGSDAVNLLMSDASASQEFGFAWVLGLKVPPVVVSLNPEHGAIHVPTTTELVLTFNENVQAGSGNVEVRVAADDSLFEAIDITDVGQVDITGAVVTISLSSSLAAGIDYYVVVPSGAIEDLVADVFAGIAAHDWQWFTQESVPAGDRRVFRAPFFR